jgi:putative aldouronate transport system permease protein
MKESLGYKTFKIFNVIIMLLVMAATLYPFLYILALSLSQENFINAGKVFLWPVGFNTVSYRLVFEHPSFLSGYMNTVRYTVFSVILNLFMTVICAYPLSKKHLPGRKILVKFIMFTMFFGGGMIPNFLLVRALGIYDTVLAITLPGAIGVWNVIMMMTFFQGIPEALEEAAYIDGLGQIGTLWRIVLPLSKPILATMILFFAVGQWNNWFGPLIYFSSNIKYPITLFLRNILLSAQQLANTSASAQAMLANQETVPAEGLKAAAIILVSVPILVLYPFAQKYFVKGVLIGSVK